MRMNKSQAASIRSKQLLSSTTHSKSTHFMRTNAMPKLWGHQANGLSPSTIRSIGARSAVDSNNFRKGGCTTSVLAIVLGEDKDPGVALPQALLKTYLKLVLSMPKHMMFIKIAWHRKLEMLRTYENRWAHVCTHLDAVIATLLDNLWEPMQPLEWHDHSGAVHAITQDNAEEVILAFTRDITNILITKASDHHLGQGAEHGVDFLEFSRHHKALIKK